MHCRSKHSGRQSQYVWSPNQEKFKMIMLAAVESLKYGRLGNRGRLEDNFQNRKSLASQDNVFDFEAGKASGRFLSRGITNCFDFIHLVSL